MKATVYIALGANLGDRKAFLEAALLQLEKHGALVSVSSFYESEAHTLDHKVHPAYLNAVCCLITKLSPFELLLVLQEIEANAGRIRKIRWENRVLDLDILFYNDWILATQTLKIPHPEIQNRNFVLLPLQEIAPSFIFPQTNKTLSEIIKSCPDKTECVPLKDNR